MRAKLDLGDGPLELLPERAVWRPRERALFVADLHLGKASAFRAFGAPAPTGASDETLRRLGALADQLQPELLVVLGDFVHASPSMTEGLAAALAEWRAQRPSLPCAIVRTRVSASRSGPLMAGTVRGSRPCHVTSTRLLVRGGELR